MTTLQIVEGLAILHCTVDEACSFFGISQPTWNQRLRDHAELKQAWSHGRAVAQVSVRRLLFERATHPTGDGARAALFLGRMLLWPQNGEDDLIEKPSGLLDGLSPEALGRLSPAEQEKLVAIMEKLRS